MISVYEISFYFFVNQYLDYFSQLFLCSLNLVYFSYKREDNKYLKIYKKITLEHHTSFLSFSTTTLIFISF